MKRALLLLLLTGISLMAQDAPFSVRVDVQLVTLDVGVLDSAGRPMTHLTQTDFQIYEDGELREIRNFSPVETPYSVLALLDCTSSVRDAWPVLTQALTKLLASMRPQDRVAVAAFGSRAELLMDWTSRDSKEGAPIPAHDSQLCARTDVYGAIQWAVSKLRGVEGRKGVVVFTDGVQTTSSATKIVELGDLRLRRIVDAKEDKPFQATLQEVRRSDAVFYFIAVATDLNPGTVDPDLSPSTEYTPLALFNLQQVRSRMEQIAEGSGGRINYPRKPGDVVPLFEQISGELGTSYGLSYAPRSGGPGRFHRIEVRVRGEGMKVRQSRTGYTEP